MQDEPRVLAEHLATLSGPDINVWLNNSGGYIALNWANNGAIGRWDYVALFDTQPTDPSGYLTWQWQYTSSQSSPYVTGTSAMGTQGPNYWIGYCAWDYAAKKYVVVASAGPYQP